MFPLLSSRIPRGGTPSPRKRRQIEKAPDPVVSAQPIDPKAHALFAAELKAIPPQRNDSSLQNAAEHKILLTPFLVGLLYPIFIVMGHFLEYIRPGTPRLC